MPAFCTHYLFMKDMQSIIKDKLGFDINESAAAIGTQGPDILFFHRIIPILMPGKSNRKIGSALHRSKAEDIFDAFRDYLKISTHKDIAKSYIYGFILHYALDRNCHPYVYAYVNKILDNNRFLHHSSAHNRIEMEMDAFLLHKKLNIENPSDFDSASTFHAANKEKEEISELLSYVIKRVLNQDINAKKIYRAIEDTIKLQKLLQDQYDILTAVCKAVETIFAPCIGFFKFSSLIKPKGWKKHIKYVNIENSKWNSPYEPERTRNESFSELYEKSKEDALALLKGFEKILNGKAESKNVTNNISFLTGCEVK